MGDLSVEKCVPCSQGDDPLKGDKAREMLADLDPAWRIVDDHHLTRDYRFKDFKEAMGFANQVADLAEAESHHPELRVGYGRLGIELFTHKVGGLSRNDFILAAKIDRLGGRKG
jgi:4a-hydroxytetrahydrobiopterin dehydratase